jgi:hypothetical protein
LAFRRDLRERAEPISAVPTFVPALHKNL